MVFHEIKFRFDRELTYDDYLESISEKINSCLNLRFDENSRPYMADGELYDFKDVSNYSPEEIRKDINSFFDFTFKEIVDSQLCRFLVLKNNDNLVILGNVHESYFDYASLSSFYDLFNAPENFSCEDDMTSRHAHLEHYLNSTDFEDDLKYWKGHLLDVGNYVKFYNIKSNNYGTVKIPFDDNALQKFMKQYDVSRFEFMAAVFSLYLSRIDRTDGCLFRTVIPGNDSDKSSLLKIEYVKDSSFAEHLNEIREVCCLAAQHTKMNVDRYIEGDLSRYSLYDYANFKNFSVFNAEGSALTLNVYEDSLELIYNSDLFSDVYISHMVENISSLMDNILSDPNQQCRNIDILSVQEKNIISNFKGETLDVGKYETLAVSFRENAIKSPDFIAVDDGINRITYGELELSTNSIAHDLRDNYGIGLGNHVALMLPRSYHYVEMFLSLNKIGVPFIPIDPSYPIKRIEHMLNISQAEYLVTTREFGDLHDLNVNVIYIEDLNRNHDVCFDVVVNPDDLFAIMFTSGTTGLPKGVMVSNRQVSGLAVAFKHIFNSSPGDVVGYFASFSFIASIRMVVTLYYGECCRIFNEIEQKDSLLLVKALKEQQMSDLILPPSLGVPIYENEDIKLKHLILAGAKLNEISKKKRYTKLVNFYGTTEIIMAMVNIIDLNDVRDNDVPVGRPIPNTWVYVLDENRMQLPIGVPGEICISSDTISPGYFNNPELTGDVFMENPYSDCDENRRMYCTGDIGFYNFDGEIVILGREDDQLSVRGFRIESGEVLSIMKAFKEIADVHLDIEHDNLFAYYTTTDDLDISDVKEALGLELPHYMIPSIFIELDEIPLNTNGKLDKFALKGIVQENRDGDIDIADDVLGAVVDAFRDVLNCDFVLIDDAFQSLGGNSLSAMKLQMLLNEKFGVNLSSGELMELATPINIANHFRFKWDVRSPSGVNYTFEDFCPLFESQLNVYLDEMVNDMGTAYNNPFIIKFNKDYSMEEIKGAIEKLFDAYPVLLARVINDDGKLSFAFDAQPQIIGGLKTDVKSFVRPFDLDKSLSRFLIVEEDDFKCLCVDFHHLIFDGSSASIILDSLTSILDGGDVDFVDNGVLRQISFEENLAEEYMDDAREFFDSMLVDRDDAYGLLSCVKIEDGDFEYVDTFDIDKEGLTSFLNNHSITPNQFFCSAFAYNLSRFAGSSKVIFNLIEDGRGHIDLSESMGMFVRTLPLLFDCRNQEISSFLEYASGIISSAMKYDLYPFRILANQYDLSPDIMFQYSHNLFSNLMDEEESDYKVNDLKHDVIGDLSFFIFDVGDDKLGIRILYSEKFSKHFIERFAASYKSILKEMMDSDALSDIDYTSSSDLDVLDSYNRTERDLSYDDILDAFNDNLSGYPNNRIVSYGNLSYSYGECAFIADVLAKRLINLGVNLQDCVPFMVERSHLYMFCALGILSVGGVYVPLDDNLPDERIRFMADDCGASVVIVSDETYERAENLFDEGVSLLNISDIVQKDIETLSMLPSVYGDLACILYTSGTTGIPKGVRITRKGITSYVDFYVDEYHMGNDSTFGLFSSIGFDVGAIRGICSPLYCGACLDIVPDDIKFDINRLNRHFIDKGVTHTTLPTQIARMFISEVDETSLEVLITGGEKLGEVNYFGDYSFNDSYGPTECCVAVCAIEASNKIDSSSIGHLFSNIKAYVLDDEKRRVPIGAVGELCIAGSQVADGYLNRKKETDVAFVKNLFDSDENYGVMYRTGDLVRVLPDGSFGIVGRRDGQVKVRGNRVELSEVESTIRNIDCVDAVSVQAVENGGNNELVAYVVTSRDIGSDALREIVCSHVAEHKPDYMVPSFVVDLDSIPLTVNGKVDRRALPEVDKGSLHAEYEYPRNEKERDIVNAFKKAFGMEKVSIHDDFIRMGGDSLTSIKVLSHLEDYDITTADILSLRTPAAIADNIDDISLELDIYSVESGCPMNEAQASLFADIVMHDNFDFYQIPTYMNIPKRYGLEKVLDALDKTLDAHPVLCMHASNRYDGNKSIYARVQDNINLFKELKNSGNDSYDAGELVGILKNKGWNIKRIYDMIRIILRLFKGQYPYMIKGSKPPVSVESDFSEGSLREFITGNLDLYNYLSAFRIFELDDSYLVLAKFHHLIFDGMSSEVFKHDFQVFLDGGVVDVDESFLKVAAFNQQVKKTDKFIEAGNFFDSMLRDIGDAGIFVGDGHSDGYGMDTYDMEIDFEALKSFLDEEGISESVFITSVFAYTLSRFSSGDKVLFSMVESGRGRFNDYNSIGLYANVVPLLIDCKNQSIDSFIKHSSDFIYGSIKYSYYPLLLLFQKYPLDTAVIFQYVPEWISYDGINDENRDLPSDFVGDMIDDLVGGIGDLMANFIVQIFQKGESYSIMFVYSNNYSEELVRDFKDTFESILSDIIYSDTSSDLEGIFGHEAGD